MMLVLYIAYINCKQHLEIFSETWVMPVNLQIAISGITHISEKIKILLSVKEGEI